MFATVPVLSMVAVFYNTRLALYLYFLLLVVAFPAGPRRHDRGSGRRPLKDAIPGTPAHTVDPS